jgi:sarcosine oxidase
MSSRSYDVAVVGLGAMGAAVAWHAARAGVRVVGFDAQRPPHTLGSTHGRSRIIREAYFEHPLYVPLVRRAFELWADLERLARRRLFQACGGLMIGRRDSQVIAGTRASAEQHGIPLQEWSPVELTRRVPALRIDDDMVGLFEPRAGVLDPEAAVDAMANEARRLGAELQFEASVAGIESAAQEMVLTTAAGDAYRAVHVICAAGHWLPTLVADAGWPLTVERAVQFWFARTGDDRFAPARFPIFILETPAMRWLYGLPDQGHGLKLAEHHGGRIVTASQIDRTVSPEERDRFRHFAQPYLPSLPDGPIDAVVCPYTNTPDGHFLLDWHPRSRGLYLLSACSGHGFKFAPAIGELVVDDVLRRAPTIDLTPFRAARFSA